MPKWRKMSAFFGPAFLISVGYMDPGNWATDIAAGSAYGYKLLWVLLMSNCMALILQYLSVKLGIVAKTDLANASRLTYSRPLNLFLYGLAEIAIIACDLAEVIGMAIGLNLLFNLPLIWGVSVTLADTALIFLLFKSGGRRMEIFILSLIFIIGFSFLIEMFLAHPVASELIGGFVPSRMNERSLYMAIGIIGATVMPHNLYLHSHLVQRVSASSEIKQALKLNLIDTGVALNLAFFINAAILILAASAFYGNGYHEVREIGDAHQLLKNVLGKWAPRLFAVALIASGQSSTITGTLAGQVIMEGHLQLKLQPWIRRLITRSVAIIPAVIVISWLGEQYLGSLLVLSQVLLSLQLGFAVVPLLHLTGDRKTMGGHVNGKLLSFLGWLCAFIVIGLNLQFLISQCLTWAHTPLFNKAILYGVIFPLLSSAVFVLLFLVVKPVIPVRR